MEALKENISPLDHKGRAYFDILEGVRREYGLDQNEICRILKINEKRYSDWKRAGRIPSLAVDIQPGINIIQFANLYNKLSSFFETTEGAISWLKEKSDVAFNGASPLSVLEKDPNGLYIVNSYLSCRMNP